MVGPASVACLLFKRFANLLGQIARSLKFPVEDGGLIFVIEDYGNTSSASMGMALDTLRRMRRIQDGEYFLLPAFGAGFIEEQACAALDFSNLTIEWRDCMRIL